MPTIEERLEKISENLNLVYLSNWQLYTLLPSIRKLAAESLPIPEAKERALQQIEMKIDATNNS